VGEDDMVGFKVDVIRGADDDERNITDLVLEEDLGAMSAFKKGGHRKCRGIR
jgi:hypothetical protein